MIREEILGCPGTPLLQTLRGGAHLTCDCTVFSGAYGEPRVRRRGIGGQRRNNRQRWCIHTLFQSFDTWKRFALQERKERATCCRYKAEFVS